MGGFVFVQGRFVFHQELARVLRPEQVCIDRFVPTDDGQRALAVLLSHSAGDPHIAKVAGLSDLTSEPPTFEPFQVPSTDWISTAQSRSGAGFLCLENGNLYWLEQAGAGGTRYFGTDPMARGGVLAWPDDGSMLVVANGHITAWDPRAAATLWRRSNLAAISCAFVPGSRRLVCCLQSGEVVELDPRTGDCVRRIARYPHAAAWVGISPDRSRLAVTRRGSDCLMANFQTGETVWTRQFHFTACPQFSADGSSLLVPALDVAPGIAVVSTSSGETVGLLKDGECVAGLHATSAGNVYARCVGGRVTAWNLATRKVLWRLDPNDRQSFDVPALSQTAPRRQSQAPPRGAVAL